MSEQEIRDLFNTTFAAQTSLAEELDVPPWEYALMVLEAMEADGDMAAALDKLIEAWDKIA